MKTLFEVADAARELGVTPASIRIYADTGRLRLAATTPRGTRLFRPDDVQRFRQSRAEARTERGESS